MTSVVVFRISDRGEDLLVAMADTRFMAQDEAGTPLRASVESGAKLFSIPLRVSKGYRFVVGEERSLLIDTSFGIAFAGNTTIGLNLVGALSQILGFLQCHDATCDISLLAVAKFATRLLNDWHRTYNQFGSWKHACEIAVFGYCPADAELQAFHLKPGQSAAGVWEVQCESVRLLNPLSEAMNGRLFDPRCHPWLILGDHRDDMEQLIKARVEDVTATRRMPTLHIEAQCSPQYVLEAVVHEECFPTIGDGVQIVVADELGARPTRWIRPQRMDIPNCEYEWFSYLNYNVEELGRLGNAEIGDSGGFAPAYVPVPANWPRFTEFDATLDKILKRYRAAIFQSTSPDT